MFIVAIVSLILLSVPACASLTPYSSLVPMSWGFPQWTQDHSLVNLEKNFAWQNDFESTDISFPTAFPASGASGLSFSTFPTISQTSNRVQVASSFKFTQEHESSQFSYPWVSVGFSPVPSMGFL